VRRYVLRHHLRIVSGISPWFRPLQLSWFESLPSRAATCLWAVLLAFSLPGANATETQSVRADEIDLPLLARSLPARVSSQTDLGTRMEDVLRTFEARRQASTPVAFDDRDEAIFRKRFDLLWVINRAVEEKQPVDPTQIGFEKMGEGRYALKKDHAARFQPLYSTLVIWEDRRNFEAHVPQLRKRGFTDEDLTSLRSYLTTTPEANSALPSNRQLMDQMAQTIRERQRRGAGISAEEFEAFHYQLRWNSENAQRQWAAGMFDVLDRRGQRLLASLVDELRAGGDYTLYITAPKESEKIAQEEIDYLASGAYVESMDQLQKSRSDKGVSR